jgi:gamma-glutamylcyclotransferase (GGCT)/AIG2-like uncharacterized protein YtfP
MDRKLYFAYGANTNIEDMRHRCPNAMPLGEYVLQDYQLVFRSVADIEFKKGSSVKGAVWSITKDCEEALDFFEGYPSFYIKKCFHKIYDGRPQSFMFYTMVDQTYRAAPRNSYLNILKEGYAHWNIDYNQLDKAINYSLNQCTAEYKW